VRALAVRPSDGALIAAVTPSINGIPPSEFYEVDPVTGAVTLLGGPDDLGQVITGALTFGADGTLWAWDVTVAQVQTGDGLIMIDLSVPSFTDVGPFGDPPTGKPQSLTERANGQLLAVNNSGDWGVYAVDPATGAPGFLLTYDTAFDIRGVESVPVGGGGPDCPGDTNGSGTVDSTDLNAVLAAFGFVGAGNPADVDGDGDVDSADLNLVLAAFGDVCS
jgi:hypothetical protein